LDCVTPNCRGRDSNHWSGHVHSTSRATHRLGRGYCSLALWFLNAFSCMMCMFFLCFRLQSVLWDMHTEQVRMSSYPHCVSVCAHTSFLPTLLHMPCSRKTILFPVCVVLCLDDSRLGSLSSSYALRVIAHRYWLRGSHARCTAVPHGCMLPFYVDTVSQHHRILEPYSPQTWHQVHE